MNFPNFIDKHHIDILCNEERKLRYYIKIPMIHSLEIPKKSVLVILKNPSAAKVNHDLQIYESDSTVNRVLNYFYKREYTDVVIINLFARYFTYSKDLNNFVNEPENIVGRLNDSYIQEALEAQCYERVVVAWGGYPQKSKQTMKNLYHERITTLERLINDKNVYYVERMVSKNRFPKHGMTWRLNAPMGKYNNNFYTALKNV